MLAAHSAGDAIFPHAQLWFRSVLTAKLWACRIFAAKAEPLHMHFRAAWITSCG